MPSGPEVACCCHSNYRLYMYSHISVYTRGATREDNKTEPDNGRIGPVLLLTTLKVGIQGDTRFQGLGIFTRVT